MTFLSAENLSGRWDPFNHTILAQDRLQRASYESLIDVDEEGNYVPGLAVEWENTAPEIWQHVAHVARLPAGVAERVSGTGHLECGKMLEVGIHCPLSICRVANE